MLTSQIKRQILDENATKTYLNLDEYRKLEKIANEHHEYCNGEIIIVPKG